MALFMEKTYVFRIIAHARKENSLPERKVLEEAG
jgi:hypothetical protein